jgi:C1A family cysteine protease
MTKIMGKCRWILYLMMILTLIVPAALANVTDNCSTSAAISNHQGEISHQKYTILRPTINEMNNWIESYKASPDAYLNPQVQNKLNSAGGSHFTIVSHLNYTPLEHDQGTCGNCWAWAGTSILEIALDSQLGIKDRLSVQYINSNYNGGNGSESSCCGGWLQDLAKFYNRKKLVVPWSNKNAQWQDGRMTCGTESNISAESISIDPHYDLNSVRVVTIPTWGIDKNESIANIKNILGQGKGVWFGFFLPNQTSWNKFFDFWGYQPECAIWQPDNSLSQYHYNDGGGHAVLCVGYNDTDPKKRYWIMLNSWGITKVRPDGFFMMSMDMNYSCAYSGLGNAFYWMTLDVDYVKSSIGRDQKHIGLTQARLKKLATLPHL